MLNFENEEFALFDSFDLNICKRQVKLFWVIFLKSVHSKKKLRNPHFFQKCCFDFSENDNTFERNEDCATVS